MEYLINIANVLYLFAYFVQGVLWLRVLSIIATSCLIPYFYLQPQPLMVAVYWNALFILLNVYWVFRLIFEQKGDEQNTSVATSRLLQGWSTCSARFGFEPTAELAASHEHSTIDTHPG